MSEETAVFELGHMQVPCLVFTALHGMQTRSSDENSVHILIETQENKTGDVLSCCIQQSSIHYMLHCIIHVRMYLPYTEKSTI